jgi:hypothetical protein
MNGPMKRRISGVAPSGACREACAVRESERGRARSRWRPPAPAAVSPGCRTRVCPGRPG